MPIEPKKTEKRPVSSDSFYKGGMQFEQASPFLKHTVLDIVETQQTMTEYKRARPIKSED
jgi:hypothetical protein